LKYIHQTHATAKSLVFSHWGDLLRLIANALTCNHIEFVQLTGSSNKKTAVERFSNSPTTRVFLLDIAKQGSGLNLVAASHVFMMEPSLNPAMEMQAIARVHRVGQTKKTVVHKVGR
jgi:E3 ubiquitin-protein ligase SHPRH